MQGPTDTDDEGEGVDDTRINALVDEFLRNNLADFLQINRYILYQMILIGNKLIANMHCVLNRKEWRIIHKCYNIIIYIIYTKSDQADKGKNVRNFLIVLTSKKFTIKGVEDVEGRLLYSAIMINQMDIFCIILSYISKTHDLDFYTKILSILVTNDTRLHLLEKFWAFMDLGNKYKDVIKISSPSSSEDIANVLKIKKFMILQPIAAPNIKRFLSYQNTLLRNSWIEKKEEYIKKRSRSSQSSNKRIKLK